MAQQEIPKKQFERERGFQEKIGYDQVIFQQIDRINALQTNMLFRSSALLLETGLGYYKMKHDMIRDLIALIPKSWQDSEYNEELEESKARHKEWAGKLTQPHMPEEENWYYEARYHQIVNLLDRRGLLLSQDKTDEI